jgi:hypothetical protein
MGRTSKPLKIVVTRPEMAEWPELRELAAKGHIIATEDRDVDLIIGPECGIMDEQHRPFLHHAIDRARALRYPKTGPKAKESPVDEADCD